ncbi:MHYT domain-containing protein [Marinactinospora thermotolerans]|uniref:MHYT domain-containing protein, NO-binding membrane sensor n=1 Tax=Marinactinospora thermotolerans DSM 45154 TaxID=1122192 RepID=A0A1T4LRK5_9ACTN|nr:MHYT domain-containing protein [Marinactinospora thermotolerans]SJZ57372.1 MHYT domain-containing protein, NO-binding membrane sensor [Marinactinospora thermotolerans DSM 45154]
MAEVEHYAYGWWTPALAYAVSCLGAFIGLTMTARARAVGGRARAGWLACAAVSIGCIGIWAMHFIAMLGFRVPGVPIRYDVLLTVLSGLLAVLVVGAGLALIGMRRRGVGALLGAGLITGLGVAGMHYLGMASMRMDAHMSHRWEFLAAAVAIGILASTAALWAALYVTGIGGGVVAALIMGAAVSAMHYTGMLGVEITPIEVTDHVVMAQEVEGHVHEHAGEGATGMDFFLPLFVGLAMLTLLFVLILVLSPGEREYGERRSFEQRLAGIRKATRSGPSPGPRPTAGTEPAVSMFERPSRPAPPTPPPGRGRGGHRRQ